MLKIRKSIALILIIFIILAGISTNVNAASYLISMSKVSVSNILEQKYTGAYIKPEVVLRYNGETLRKNVDYTVSYRNNRNIGTATVTITGKGNYLGTKIVNFKIVSTKNSSSSKVYMSDVAIERIANQTYTGTYIKPSVNVRYNGYRLNEGTDYTLSYSNNKNVGTATVKVIGKGQYTGTRTLTFLIVRNNYNYDYDYDYNSRISMSKVTASSISNKTYTGSYIKPSVTLKYNGYRLEEGEDYTLSYSNNKNVGKAKVKITGRGIYTGTKTVNFKIVKKNNYDYGYTTTRKSLNPATVTRVYEHDYTGDYIEPEVRISYYGELLEEGEDYIVTYTNNKNVGTGTIYVEGIGEYSGARIIYFKIAGKSISISKATVSSILNQTYTGKYIRPNVTVKYDGERLEEGTDYTLSYSNNKNVGTAKVTITGRGNYKGTKTVTFKIVDDYDYDYDDDYSYNSKISLSKVSASNILNQRYTGSYVKPSVVLRYNGNKLKQGTDYTVSYSNNKSVGTARVTIKGKGKYTGTKTLTFKIVK